MSNRNSSNRGWLAGFIGLVASCIGIYAFFTGYASLPEALNNFNDPSANEDSNSGMNIMDLFASPTPTPGIPLDTYPSWFFPDESDINPDWQEVENVSASNEETAKGFDNPSDILLLLESFGRITGQKITYNHKLDCDFKIGPQFMIFSTTVYQTADGASKSLAWFAEQDKKISASQSPFYEVGTEAIITWFDTQNGCDPPDDSRQVSIRFRKYNITAIVLVSSVKDSLSDDEALKSALFFAKRIELKITSYSLDK